MPEIIDVEKTASVYRDQLDSFMSSFIMNCSPFDKDMDSLLSEARARAINRGGNSWLDRARFFCSCHIIESAQLIENPNYRPFRQYRLSPAVDIFTSNWFIWNYRPCFEALAAGLESRDYEYGEPTRSCFIDIPYTNDQLAYLKDNIGEKIILCYTFRTDSGFRNGMGNERSCYRFSKIENLRTAILRTQFFVLDYLERHPLDCFNGPYMENRPITESIFDNNIKWQILEPILDDYRQSLSSRKAAVLGELVLRHIPFESI